MTGQKTGDSKMKQIVKDALKIDEMIFAFECICPDDGKNPEDYTDEELVTEAEYRLYTYFESGHMNNDEMRLGNDPEARKQARTDIRKLRAFIKKYKTHETVYTAWLREVNQVVV
jgi:acetoacetate decarboxylase